MYNGVYMYNKKVINGVIVFCGFCKIQMIVHHSRISQNKLGIIHCSQKCKSQSIKNGTAGFGLKKTNNNLGYKKCYKYKVKTVAGIRIYEHRYIMQNHLGRKLDSNEFVHHINGDTKDNRIENLMLVNNHSHGKIEFSQNDRIYR